MQLGTDFASLACDSVAAEGKTAAATAFSFQFVLNFLLNFVMSDLWSAIGNLQLVILFPLLLVKMPANSVTFFSYLREVAFFDLINTQDFLDEYFPVESGDALEFQI